MRFDLIHFLPNPGRTRPWGALLDDARARAELADELGFDGLWLGEHHFDAEGTDQLPNPVMLAADLAARTSRIRLGMSAVTLPLWHPVRLAEDLAMLDHFSGGRLDVAFSRGILAGEILNLNADADRADEARSRAIFAEHLEIVKRAWTEDPFSWHGERYDLPHPASRWPGKAYTSYHGDDGLLEGLAIIPQPLQAPMPPLFAVTQQEEGFRQAARDGMGVITSHPTGRRLAGLNAAYREEAGDGSRRSAIVLRDVMVAETDAEARRLMEPSVTERFELIRRVRGLGAWLDLGEDPEDPALRATSGFDLLLERDYLMCGSPDSVAERMIRVAREQEVDHWMLSTATSDERALRRFAEEVLPAVRGALVA
jgi:alkanesulfonate monooxygenase SsuD/methylene tetrahydromethanopterin reductase-like flavin-dependent oxidoreductase (luciferase family)